jgi:hypothetical protein
MLRYNDQGGSPVAMEYYDGANWTELATGGGGSGTVWAWGFLDAGLVVPGSFSLLYGSNISSVTTTNWTFGSWRVNFSVPAPTSNYIVSVFAGSGVNVSSNIGDWTTTSASGASRTVGGAQYPCSVLVII